jgi:hypothetical protein
VRAGSDTGSSKRAAPAVPSWAAILVVVAAPDLSGVTIVGGGSFNPAIIHPRWLADKDLIPENAAEHAMKPDPSQPLLVSPQLSVFVADWLSVQVTQEQAVFSTVDQGRELDLRDFARSVFELLPETPVDAIGINADTHFKSGSEEAWHTFGDRFLPKDFWEPIFEDDIWRKRPDGQRAGMRVMTVEVNRDDPELPGHVRVELAPSVRATPYGIYIGINAHFQLTKTGDKRGTADDAARVLIDQWHDTREIESRLISRLLEAI